MRGSKLRLVITAGLIVVVCASVGFYCQATSEQGAGSKVSDVRDDYGRERLSMVQRQIQARGVTDPAVLEAMQSVPRHEFVPAELRDSAYADHPLPIGEGQTISQPYIVALMTESLRLGPTDRVLELGTGSGYQAAVLAAIVDSVFTIEYFPSLAQQAVERLNRLGYGNVRVKAGDGWGGWPEHAPYQGIIVTFAAPDVPEAAVQQLTVGGRLCIPLGEAHAVQELMVYTKQTDGSLAGQSLGAVRFVPVLGDR
jgi:protein-L-isoaspartate(D-aspartate) O-methyltransferase